MKRGKVAVAFFVSLLPLRSEQPVFGRVGGGLFANPRSQVDGTKVPALWLCWAIGRLGAARIQ